MPLRSWCSGWRPDSARLKRRRLRRRRLASRELTEIPLNPDTALTIPRKRAVTLGLDARDHAKADEALRDAKNLEGAAMRRMTMGRLLRVFALFFTASLQRRARSRTIVSAGADRILAAGRKARELALVLVWVVALFGQAAYASEQRMRLGALDAFVWTPDDLSTAPWPVVVFSHGVYMCGNQSRFLTEALAAAGYLVIAPNHTDASCRAFDAGAFNSSGSPLKPASMWTDADYRDRANDVRSALGALSSDPRLSGYADRTRVALAGHSLGGYTVLGVGGAWPAWRLPGLKAILAMAPYALPYAGSRGVHELDAPVMYQAGSFDPVFTAPLHGSDGAYERSPSPKYYVEIAATSHAGWLDPAGPGGREIVDYAVAFFDCYVKGMPESPLLRSRQPGLVDLRRDVRAEANDRAERRREDVARRVL